MADMHRSGRIRRHIFDIDLLALAQGRIAVSDTSLQQIPQAVGPIEIDQAQIEKARTGHLHLGHRRQTAQLGGQQIGQGARRHAGLLAQHHRGIGGDVAMTDVARRLGGDLGHIKAGRQFAGLGQAAQGGQDIVAEGGKQIHRANLTAKSGRFLHIEQAPIVI